MERIEQYIKILDAMGNNTDYPLIPLIESIGSPFVISFMVVLFTGTSDSFWFSGFPTQDYGASSVLQEITDLN